MSRHSRVGSEKRIYTTKEGSEVVVVKHYKDLVDCSSVAQSVGGGGRVLHRETTRVDVSGDISEVNAKQLIDWIMARCSTPVPDFLSNLIER